MTPRSRSSSSGGKGSARWSSMATPACPACRGRRASAASTAHCESAGRQQLVREFSLPALPRSHFGCCRLCLAGYLPARQAVGQGAAATGQPQHRHRARGELVGPELEAQGGAGGGLELSERQWHLFHGDFGEDGHQRQRALRGDRAQAAEEHAAAACRRRRACDCERSRGLEEVGLLLSGGTAPRRRRMTDDVGASVAQ